LNILFSTGNTETGSQNGKASGKKTQNKSNKKGKGNKNGIKKTNGKGDKEQSKKGPKNVLPKENDLDIQFNDSKVLSNGMIAEKSKYIN
jgi:hypothetical protein